MVCLINLRRQQRRDRDTPEPPPWTRATQITQATKRDGLNWRGSGPLVLSKTKPWIVAIKHLAANTTHHRGRDIHRLWQRPLRKSRSPTRTPVRYLAASPLRHSCLCRPSNSPALRDGTIFPTPQGSKERHMIDHLPGGLGTSINFFVSFNSFARSQRTGGGRKRHETGDGTI